MPPTQESAASSKIVSFGDANDFASDDDIDEDEVEATLRNFAGAQQGLPHVNRNQQVVGRLSRWEGGNHLDPNLFSKTAQDAHTKTNNSRSSMESQPEHILKFRDLLLVFSNDDEIMEVTEEDVERVRIMHAKFLEGSKFSFNYNSLLLIAAVIAACGLGGNSVATIIASMLVSPLMGPVVGMAYANTICDYKMFRIALTTEIISIIVCIIVGLVTAGCMIPFAVSETWPTQEMYNRGTMSNFWMGFPIAFFSGLGVAVGLLDEQTSSLVGVAISASLLPPAVNSGMLWISWFAYDPAVDQFGYDASRGDFRKWGLTSLGLTLINIVMIIISSMLMVSTEC
jgi:uncharacterized hydrophobic protein (TIGR00271 family)